MPRRSHFDGMLDLVQAALGWAALTLVLLSVLVRGGNEPVAWSLLALSVLGLFALQLPLLLLRGPPRALRNAVPMTLLYGAVLCWGLVQVALPAPAGLAHPVWSFAPEAAVPRIGADPGQGGHIVLRLASYAMIAWIFAASALRSSQAWAMLMAVGLFSAGLATFGLVAGLSGTNPFLGIDSGRAGPVTATFVNRNSYATYAAFGMLVNTAVYLHLSRNRESVEGRKALRAFLEAFFGGGWLFALGALICGAAVALTESRAGGASAALGLIVLLAASRRAGRGGALALGVVAALLLGFVVFSLGSGTFDRFVSGSGGQARFVVYAAIVEHLPERAWLGHGVGAFHDTFRAYLPLEAASAEWNLAHSSYLENAWEMGLPAAALFYVALGLVGLRFLRGLAVRQSNHALPALGLAVFVTGALHATVDFSLQMPACAALFAALMGIGWAQSFPRHDRVSQSGGTSRATVAAASSGVRGGYPAARIVTTLAAALCLFGAAGEARAQGTPEAGTRGAAEARVAIIGAETITEEELDAAFAARGARLGSDPEAARQQMLDLLAAEFWVQQNFASRVRTNPALRAALSEAERQILFDLYAQSRFDPVPPTDAEIDAYIARHPEFFADRIDYRFQRFVVVTGNEAEATQADALLDGLRTAPAPTPEAASALARALAEAGLRFERSSLWTGSETLSEPVRARLDALRLSDGAVDVVATPGRTDVLVLFDARPDPVDPALLRDGIAARLMEESYRVHRAALAAQIAAPLREAAATGAAPPIGERLAAALAGMGASLGLVLAAAFAWHARARQHFRLARLDNTDDHLSLLQRPGPVLALAALLAGMACAAAAFALSTRPAALLSLSGPSVFLGAAVLALGLGLLLWRGREATLAQARRRKAGAALRAVLLLLLQLGVCYVFAFLPGLYLYQ